MPLCRGCGKAVDDSDKFCRNCGAVQLVSIPNVNRTDNLKPGDTELQKGLFPRSYFLPFVYFFWCWLVVTTFFTLISGGSFPLIQGFSIIGLVGIAITLTFALMAHASVHHRNCLIWLIACVVFSVYFAGLIYLLTMVITTSKRGLRF